MVIQAELVKTTLSKIPLARKTATPNCPKKILGLKKASPPKIPLALKSPNPKKTLVLKSQNKGQIHLKLATELRKLQFTGQLYEFQQNVIKWSHEISRGILGLDMGLGKTVMAIDIICERQYIKSIIV